MESFIFRCARCITKRESNACGKRTVLSDWTWAASNYDFTIGKSKSTIKKITIDPSGLMADVKQENNVYKHKNVLSLSFDS
jgi:hypothetical protein